MDQGQLQEWARHFDILLWSMVAFVGAGIVALLVYSSETPNLWICLGGVLATDVAVYLTASFRGLRRKIHAQLEDSIVATIRPDKFRQWPALLLLVAAFLAAWVGMLQEIEPNLLLLWIGVGVVSFFLCVYWVIAADRLVARKRPPETVRD